MWVIVSDCSSPSLKLCAAPGWRAGLKRFRKQAEWLQRQYPQVAASLREGLEEILTINRLQLPGSLRANLGSTNLIESPFSSLKTRTRRVGRPRAV